MSGTNQFGARRPHGATAIFISYRRDDAAGHAGRLADRLKAHFGEDSVFMDVAGSIKPGEQFREVIERAVSSCAALLVVIGRHWLTDPAGNRRLDNPEDFVRLEIARALSRNVCVIPVLVDRATLPLPEDLAEELRRLVDLQAIELSESRWDFEVSQIISALEGVLPEEPPHGNFLNRLKVLTATALLIAAGSAAWMFGPQDFDVRLWTSPGTPPDIGSPSTSGSTPVDKSTKSPPAGPHRQLIAVPDFRTMDLEVAKSRIRESGLALGQISFRTLPDRAPNTVYHQDTPAGARVRPDSPIGLSVVRQRRAGIQSSGLVSLSDSEVLDLDGTRNSGRDGLDVRFDGSIPGEPRLQPLDGAQLSVFGRSPPGRDHCERATFSPLSSIRVQIGTYLCARTGEGRYASLSIEDLSSELRLSFDTWELSASTSQHPSPESAVRLTNRESYDFSSETRGTLSGGDFYVTIANNGAAQFFANNRGQRGLVDLGDVGRQPLMSVTPPANGYYQFGVPIVEGHTYVSLASEGEEGHFIIFRVTRVADTFVILSYIYR